MPWIAQAGLGRGCLLATALGLVGGGLTILVVGMTTVFVPQDLGYLGVGAEELHSLNARLVPLIAHARAGFGGGGLLFRSSDAQRHLVREAVAEPLAGAGLVGHDRLRRRDRSASSSSATMTPSIIPRPCSVPSCTRRGC